MAERKEGNFVLYNPKTGKFLQNAENRRKKIIFGGFENAACYTLNTARSARWKYGKPCVIRNRKSFLEYYKPPKPKNEKLAGISFAEAEALCERVEYLFR